MYELRITDGLTTVELAALPNTLIEYVPRAPEPAAVADAVLLDWAEYPYAGSPGRGPRTGPDPDTGCVAERLRVALGGATLAPALAERDRVERLFRQAERVAAGSGEAPVSVECRYIAESALYRCRLLAGALAEMDGEGFWPALGQLRVDITWTRRAYWEGAEAEVPLLGPAGDPQAGGMEVLCLAGPRGSAGYVDLAAIAGDLPAPLRFRFTNLAASYPVGRLYAGLRSAAEPIALLHLIEGEAAVSGGVTQPAGLDGQYSGGRYRAVTWQEATETRLLAWTLDGGQLALAAGRWYRLLARWAPAPAVTDLSVQVRITLGGATTLWAGPWLRTSAGHEICDLGSLALPPFAGPAAGLAALQLELWGRRNVPGPHTLNVDYLGLLAQDGFRRYDALAGAALDLNDYLEDDGPAAALFTHSAAGNVDDWLATGRGLSVRPGCQHRLCLLWEDTTGHARGDRLAKVQLWYRPRVVLP